FPRDAGASRRHHFLAVCDDVLLGVAQTVVAFTLLAHNAFLSLDAVARTFVRMHLTRRRLLEWVTAAQAKRLASLAFADFVWPLRGATIVAIGATAAVLGFNRDALAFAAPLIVLWWASPVLARIISLPPGRVVAEPLPPAHARQLRRAARRTWHFFDAFV